MSNTNFKFEISLSVLNHLGRNLYRSFATVLGEAISNSWDADAKNVYIYINKEGNDFFIKDDGIGMDEDDFQTKFLKIGYSKRMGGKFKSPGGRSFIGRKGIGKLALLSCADKISVISKVDGGKYTGGVINNSRLDEEIKRDVTPDKYSLENFDMGSFSKYTDGHEHGTIIQFDGIKGGIKNSLDFLGKIIALYFRFSLLDNSFNIHINDKKITLDQLDKLAGDTQFLWNINNLSDPYISERLKNLKENSIPVQMNGNVRGFIASVNKPSELKIRTMGEKVSIDLFVNGRLREKDILKYISAARITESYFYGQIHFDDLDGDGVDRFTSSREGIQADDPKYKEFLEELKEKISTIMGDWDKLRRKHRKDGDSENPDMTPKRRKAQEFTNAIMAEFELPEGAKNYAEIDGWIENLQGDAEFNFISYADCFVSENLLRNYIEKGGLTPTACVKGRQNQKCSCPYCKGEDAKRRLKNLKNSVDINIQIKSDEENLLTYLEYMDLAKIIDENVLKKEDKSYRPFRNSVMHTARLTEEAKTKLASVSDNIVATVKKLFT